MVDRRQIGGLSNRRGNRYEDHFIVFKLLEHGRRLQDDLAASARFKEQAGCPVDDLLIAEPRVSHYYQLKSSSQITWGERGGKLRLEFEEQARECRRDNRPFTLTIVIAHESRERSLVKNMPNSVADVTSVFHFPRLDRLSDLPLRLPQAARHLRALAATTEESTTEFEHIVKAFLVAWLDRVPDGEGFSDVAALVEAVRRDGIGRLCRAWEDPPEAWPDCRDVLERVPGFSFSVDRGYFEWRAGNLDGGLSREPCDSESFRRFISRVGQVRPASFEELEELLP